MIALAGSVSAFLIAPLTVSAQVASSTQDEDRRVLKTLLEEIRTLRLALQRTNVLSQRIQVTLERMRLQQARVDSITRSLQTIRSRLLEMSRTRLQTENDIKNDEEQTPTAPTPDARAGLELQIREAKKRLVLLAREEEEERGRELETSNELQSAQARLSELNKQLDTFMRDLEAP